jgi:hypothetical protein
LLLGAFEMKGIGLYSVTSPLVSPLGSYLSRRKFSSI